MKVLTCRSCISASFRGRFREGKVLGSEGLGGKVMKLRGRLQEGKVLGSEGLGGKVMKRRFGRSSDPKVSRKVSRLRCFRQRRFWREGYEANVLLWFC